MIDYHFNLIHASNVKSDYLNLTGVTSGAGSANPSRASDFTSGF